MKDENVSSGSDRDIRSQSDRDSDEDDESISRPERRRRKHVRKSKRSHKKSERSSTSRNKSESRHERDKRSKKDRRHKDRERDRKRDRDDDEKSDNLSDDSSENPMERSKDRKRHHHKRTHRRHEEERKKGEGRKKRRRDENDSISSKGGESDGNIYSSEDDERNKRQRDRKRRKKDRKKRSHRDKKRVRDTHEEKERGEGRQDANGGGEEKNVYNNKYQALIAAICQLFEDCPAFADELPLIFIRMAGGTTFDLSRMTDVKASQGLFRVFHSLGEYGVKQREGDGQWMFQTPGGSLKTDELVLLRLMRSILDDVGVTMTAIRNYEDHQHRQEIPSQSEAHGTCISDFEDIKTTVWKILAEFASKDENLGTQLASLCETITDGESVSIDGIPDENLKTALEGVFLQCGLEKSEMVQSDDDDDDDDDDTEALMGYGIPESGNLETVKLRLAAMVDACRTPTNKFSQNNRRVMGPQRGPTPSGGRDAVDDDDDDEDEGPQLPGAARKIRGPAISSEIIKAQAEQREFELKATVQGMSPSAIATLQKGGREEWMITPGKFDFLSSIKSGQTIKSRTFQNTKSNQKDENENEQPIHPAIQAEMDEIVAAHNSARGPSMIDQHRARKKQERMEKAAQRNNGKKKSQNWEWNREKDLDAGRRVDKDALHMVLGGAAENLKTKFQGGFNR